eukprot:1458380-Prymnesium_polylepis.1
MAARVRSLVRAVGRRGAARAGLSPRAPPRRAAGRRRADAAAQSACTCARTRRTSGGHRAEHGHAPRLEEARAQVERVDRISDARLADEEHGRAARDRNVGGGAADDRADRRVAHAVDQRQPLPL